MPKIKVSADWTPNPNAMKFTCSVQVTEKPLNFADANEATGDELAESIFAVMGVASVFMVNDFISVNKIPQADWDDMVARITNAIVENLGQS